MSTGQEISATRPLYEIAWELIEALDRLPHEGPIIEAANAIRDRDKSFPATQRAMARRLAAFLMDEWHRRGRGNVL